MKSRIFENPENDEIEPRPVLPSVPNEKDSSMNTRTWEKHIYSMFQKYWITSCDGCHFRPNGPIDTKFGEGVHEGLN